MSGFQNNTSKTVQATRSITVDNILPKAERSFVALDEKALGDHLEKYLQAEDNKSRTFVFSCVFGGPHLYCFPPSEKLNRPFWTIVTMGMSGTQMKVPAGIENPKDFERAEVKKANVLRMHYHVFMFLCL
jgi:hypothetical protein